MMDSTKEIPGKDVKRESLLAFFSLDDLSIPSLNRQLKDSSFIQFVPEFILSFIFWCLFIEFMPTLWYIPMNKMAVSGVEPILFFPSLCMLFIPSLRTRPKISILFYFLGLLGIPSLFIPELILSGTVQCLGTGFIAAPLLSSLWNDDKEKRLRTGYSLVLSLLALVAIRFGLSSVNPIFFYPKFNIILFCLGLLSLALKIKFMPVYTSHSEKKSDDPLPVNTALSTIKNGFGFGCYLSLVVLFLTEHGVLARLADEHPFPIGICMIISFLIGIAVSHLPIVRSPIWFAGAILSTCSIMWGPVPYAAWAGLFLITYLVSIWVPISEDLFKHAHAGRSLFIATFVYVFLGIAHVWVVAYKFVPILGKEMREQTPLLVLFSLVCVKLTYSFHNSSFKPSKPSKYLVTMLILIVFFLIVPSTIYRSIHYKNYDAKGLDKTNVRGMIWAIHFAYDNFGRPSFHAMLDEIKKTTANVIGLVETDLMRIFSGNRDVVEWLETELHMYSDYGSSTLNHTWGCALLSAFPILRAHHINLPSPEGENACLIDAELDVNGHVVNVMVSHFGNTEDELDRKLQTEETYNHIMRVPEGRPFVWLGYFTATPYSENYYKIMQTGVKDSTNDRDRYCEYIWYKNFEKRVFKRINEGDVSDTEIQYIEFEPLKNQTK